MKNLEEMTRLVKGIRINYLPELLQSPNPKKVDLVLITENFDEGWYKKYTK